jgi:hypothetical protein
MINNMSEYIKVAVIVVIAMTIVAAATTSITAILQPQIVYAGLTMDTSAPRKAPIATSGDKNVYVTWWNNKTGNDEVMFKASTDAGKTFGDKMNLSNSTNAQSQDVQIAASGNNVYVSWWEHNQTSNEPVLRVSNDKGKTFGQSLMLSNK